MVKGLRITAVVENSASLSNPQVWAQHGLCLHLEADLGAQRMNLLLDTGASSEVTLHNIDIMGIDLQQTDLIILSHGHYDHTGGLLGVLERTGKRTPILAHPDFSHPKLKTRPFLKFIGLPFTVQEAESAGAIMLYSRGSTKLADGIFATGEVRRDTSFEKVEGFRTLKEGELVNDKIMDDQALVIDVEEKGLVVVTGCAHSGIVNTVRQAQRLSGTQEVYAIVGGFHLQGASEERLAATVDELMKLDPQILRPGHCTGAKAICRLMQAFGDRCEPLAAGDVMEL
jgi:7,8-dihydropterin-6-yl-methyl-4-(beta-D-ribofuranosyl)aminobenzene 5'-phosphate synthase